MPDARFDWLCELYKPSSRVPAHLTCLDIAGLTAVRPLSLCPCATSLSLQGASTGAGLGNAFLSHVRAVDGIFQVVRAFDDAEIIHVEGDVDPLRDMEIIQTELRLKDIEWVEKHLDGLKKSGRSLGSNSLADKAKKEEIVSPSMCRSDRTQSDLLRRALGYSGEDLQDVDRGPKGCTKGRLDEQGGTRSYHVFCQVLCVHVLSRPHCWLHRHITGTWQLK